MEDGTSKSPGSCADTVSDWDPFQWDAREDCEVRQILDRIADKWSLLAIALLEGRTLRFGELRREIDGISQRMLTVTRASVPELFASRKLQPRGPGTAAAVLTRPASVSRP